MRILRQQGLTRLLMAKFVFIIQMGVVTGSTKLLSRFQLLLVLSSTGLALMGSKVILRLLEISMLILWSNTLFSSVTVSGKTKILLVTGLLLVVKLPQTWALGILFSQAMAINLVPKTLVMCYATATIKKRWECWTLHNKKELREYWTTFKSWWTKSVRKMDSSLLI